MTLISLFMKKCSDTKFYTLAQQKNRFSRSVGQKCTKFAQKVQKLKFYENEIQLVAKRFVEKK